ncbi:MAG: winged helix-turn-helix transcriptional regulator [Elusimicrobiota bacterium]
MGEREFSLIQEISREPSRTQRELSQSTGLSLGMTNILLKRLVHKGYIKVKHLDWKRTQYLLTMKGVMEKTRKSFSYALHTIRQFRIISKRIHDLVQREYERGERAAIVVAWPETADAVREALADMEATDFKMYYVETFKELGERPGLIFTATVEDIPPPKAGQRFVPLLDNDALKFKFDS